MANRVNVLGVGVSVLNLQSALEAIAGAVREKRKGYICVTGVHGVIEAQSDETFRKILNKAFLCTPDGMPMVWMGKIRGHSEMRRVYGPDLMLAVCDYTRSRGFTHFLYGGGLGVAQELKVRLEQKLPGLRIVGALTPPFRPLNALEEADLAAQLRALRPDLLWVGLSTPKQERFMAQYWQRLEATLLVGVGAAFDFHAGRVRQAPPWVQRHGLEWLFRLACEPRRLWKRYLKNNPLFLARAFCQLSRIRAYPMD